MDWQRYGDRGVLLSHLPQALRARLVERFTETLPDGAEEFVIGYDSILLIGPTAELGEFADSLLRSDESFEGEAMPQSDVPVHEIPVRYNGPDMEAVAAQCGLTVQKVIQLHSEPTYRVHMMGFAPGFPYLEGLDQRLHLARRASPRNHIPPGSVAIGGPHAGIYSVASPGGWHLLGATDWPLFRPEAAQKADPTPTTVFTLKPGDRVRFRAVDFA